MIIIGIKCEGCRMWTRIDGEKILPIAMFMKSTDHYYCDECLSNVTYHTTKATIKLKE